jgi:hypothetical protein
MDVGNLEVIIEQSPRSKARQDIIKVANEAKESVVMRRTG